MIVFFAVLLVVALGVLGAVLHPILMLLHLIHVDHVGAVVFLDRTKSFMVDSALWGLFSLLTLGALLVASSRLKRRSRKETAHNRHDDYLRGPVDRGQTRFAVAVTAFDEADVIARVVSDFLTQENVVAVIVVDNNSRDDTAARAIAAGARVVRETQQGYGYACIRGLREAMTVPQANVIILTEGDGTFSAEDLRKFQNYICHVDMVTGTRVVPRLAERDSQMDHFFVWGNVAISTLLRLRFWDSQFLGAARLSDIGCTFRAIGRPALERILPDLEVGGDHFSLHMMLVALDRRLSVVEIPVTFRQRVGQSKGASRSVWQGLRVGLMMIYHIMMYKPAKSVSPEALSRRPSSIIARKSE